MEYMYSNTQYLHDCKDKDYVGYENFSLEI